MCNIAHRAVQCASAHCNVGTPPSPRGPPAPGEWGEGSAGSQVVPTFAWSQMHCTSPPATKAAGHVPTLGEIPDSFGGGRPPPKQATQEHPMPQFDIASLHPQTTFFAGILSTSHVSSCKNILPKVSQNPKPNKRIAEIYNVFAVKGSRDLCLLSHIYQPAKIVSHSVPREVLRLIRSGRFIDQITISYMSSPNRPSRHKSQHARIRLLRLSNIYLSTSSDTYSSTTKARHSK